VTSGYNLGIHVSGLGDPPPGKKPKRAPRINGPFQGRWRGTVDFDLTIHDLSITGCLIESFHEMPAGRRMTIEIDLPEEGTVSVSAESVYSRPDFGYGVKFIDVPPQTRVHLARAVFHKLTKSKSAPDG
jgi:hypothetical protein